MKLIYLIIGTISMVLGAIGVFLPILPTAPFLLLTAFCYARGSDRFHEWFTKTNLYKRHLDSFIQHRQMSRKSKIMVLTFASSMLLAAMYFMENTWLRMFIICLMIFKYYYFFYHIKTVA